MTERAKSVTLLRGHISDTVPSATKPRAARSRTKIIQALAQTPTNACEIMRDYR